MNRVPDDLLIKLAVKYHTPLYVFDELTVRSKCNELKRALSYDNVKIRYACKALTLQAIMRIMLDEGMWIDASSINEVHRALRAGFNPAEIDYTGEGATAEVYKYLVERGVLINCTSLDLLRLLGSVKPGHYCSIRINPGEGHGESNRTNTGGPSSKHGIYKDQIDEAKAIARSFDLKIIGVHSHIGSGSKPEEWRQWNAINEIALDIARGFGREIEFVNLGGGLPVPYRAGEQPMDVKAWGAELSASMKKFASDMGKDVRFFIEPGRFLVAEGGMLLAEIQALKSTPTEGMISGYNYAVVNTGLNHNVRPAMYGSYHEIYFIPKDTAPRGENKEYVVAGYLCESGDVFTADKNGVLLPRSFPELRVGDLMVMANVGAYSHAMKSEYNSMNLPASVLIDARGNDKVIERRGTLEDVMRRELDVYIEGRAVTM